MLGDGYVWISHCVGTVSGKVPLLVWAVWIARLDNWSDHHVWYRLPATKLFVEILTNYPKLFFSPRLDTILVGRMLYSNRNTVQLFALLIWLLIVFVLRDNFSLTLRHFILCNWSRTEFFSVHICFSACKTFSSAALLLKNSFIRYDLACTNYSFMK